MPLRLRLDPCFHPFAPKILFFDDLSHTLPLGGYDSSSAFPSSESSDNGIFPTELPCLAQISFDGRDLLLSETAASVFARFGCLLNSESLRTASSSGSPIQLRTGDQIELGWFDTDAATGIPRCDPWDFVNRMSCRVTITTTTPLPEPIRTTPDASSSHRPPATLFSSDTLPSPPPSASATTSGPTSVLPSGLPPPPLTSAASFRYGDFVRRITSSPSPGRPLKPATLSLASDSRAAPLASTAPASSAASPSLLASTTPLSDAEGVTVVSFFAPSTTSVPTSVLQSRPASLPSTSVPTSGLAGDAQPADFFSVVGSSSTGEGDEEDLLLQLREGSERNGHTSGDGLMTPGCSSTDSDLTGDSSSDDTPTSAELAIHRMRTAWEEARLSVTVNCDSAATALQRVRDAWLQARALVVSASLSARALASSPVVPRPTTAPILGPSTAAASTAAPPCAALTRTSLGRPQLTPQSAISTFGSKFLGPAGAPFTNTTSPASFPSLVLAAAPPQLHTHVIGSSSSSFQKQSDFIQHRVPVLLGLSPFAHDIVWRLLSLRYVALLPGAS